MRYKCLATQKEKHLQEEIEREKKKQYQIKYSLW